MYFQGTPREPRPRRGRLAALALGSFVAAAVALTAGIRAAGSGSAGAPADDAKLMTGIPDVVAFNGYAARYRDEPIVVKRGERIRAFVLAAGPNTWSAFHVVGTIFDRVWNDGIFPENMSRGNQSLNLSASQGAVAEFTLDEEGVYPFVTHDFTNATKGAVGVLKTEGATGSRSR